MYKEIPGDSSNQKRKEWYDVVREVIKETMFHHRVYIVLCVSGLLLVLCTTAASEETQIQLSLSPSFTLSPCGTPVSIAFTGIFDAYETACTQFSAQSSLEVLNISFYFDDVEHTSSPADLDLTITALASHQTLHIGGWDDDVRFTADEFEWPNEWQFSAEAGLYSAALDVQSAYMNDDGVYEMCVMNKWLNSGEAIYNGSIQLQGLVSACTLTHAPTITPDISAAESSTDCTGQVGVDIAFDVSFAGKQKKCMPPFLAQGALLAVNVDLVFVAKPMYLGVVPIQQTMWPADLELSLTQLSLTQSVVIGYDPLDNGTATYTCMIYLMFNILL